MGKQWNGYRGGGGGYQGYRKGGGYAKTKYISGGSFKKKPFRAQSATMSVATDTVKITKVKKLDGKMAGKLLVRITGPRARAVNRKSGAKTLYASTVTEAKSKAAKFIGHSSYDCEVEHGLAGFNATPQSFQTTTAPAAYPTAYQTAFPTVYPTTYPTASYPSSSVSSKSFGQSTPRSAQYGGAYAYPYTSSYPSKSSPHTAPVHSACIDLTSGEEPDISCLTADQKFVFQQVMGGQNTFLTGAAGTGKSFLFRKIIKALKAKHGAEAVAVTAPTGVAAVNVNGITIHSFSGIGLGRGSLDKLVSKVEGSYKATERWRKTRVLLIDEVSMLDDQLFQKLSHIGARIRGVSRPFGGIQVVCCGDFYQLPPVGIGQYGKSFCFKAYAWQELRMATCNLTEIIRQKGDLAFVNMLNELRKGRLSPVTQLKLAECHVSRKPPPKDGILPTKLFCINRNVDAENEMRLNLLKGKKEFFESVDVIKRQPSTKDAKKLLDAAEKKVASRLQLKLGAQVVLLRNLSAKLVNGSRGVVVKFEEVTFEEQRRGGYGTKQTVYCPIVKFDCGIQQALKPQEFFVGLGSEGALVRTQIPLKLAWALTIHKCQGMTLSRVEVQAANAFECGQVYVALSRCVSLDGLWISGAIPDQSAVMAHPSVVAFYTHGS